MMEEIAEKEPKNGIPECTTVNRFRQRKTRIEIQ